MIDPWHCHAPRTHRLEHVRLYRDELEQIIHAVDEIGEATVEGPGSANEISPTGSAGTSGLAGGHRRSWPAALRVVLGRTNAVAEITEPNTLVLDVLNRVVGICPALGRWVAPGLGGSAPARADRIATHVLAAMPGAGLAAQLLEGRGRGSAVLINACRADRPTFWQRKRDALAINAVVLVLGGLIGYFVNELQAWLRTGTEIRPRPAADIGSCWSEAVGR